WLAIFFFFFFALFPLSALGLYHLLYLYVCYVLKQGLCFEFCIIMSSFSSLNFLHAFLYTVKSNLHSWRGSRPRQKELNVAYSNTMV
ncbi:hypothetical protein BGX38DRAFT_1175475, partial [Terfezia claveryi]